MLVLDSLISKRCKPDVILPHCAKSFSKKVKFHDFNLEIFTSDYIIDEHVPLEVFKASDEDILLISKTELVKFARRIMNKGN